MTAQESYKMALAIYCEGLETVAVGCKGEHCEYAEEDPDHRCEASFSWAQCDSCGSTLGGDRETAYGLYRDDDDKLIDIEMSICVDCIMFWANGDLPEVWQ